MARSVTSIKVEGGLLPADFLRKLGQGDDGSIPGLTAASYHLDGTRLHDAISASWNALRSRWVAFSAALEKLPESDHATSLTRERFLLPLFAELQYGRLVAVKAREMDGREYAISHYWANSPIQLLGANVPLDRRTSGVAGASRTSPHGMVQDYLNRTPETLWGFLSNGRLLRVLRDSKSLARASFIEFDLTTMFESEAYSDFVILWLLCHQSRVEADDPHKCHLEKWMELAHEQGTRALDKLRYGVAQALIDLGQGFIEDPVNKRLRELLTSENLSTVEYYKQVIRVIYRLMFLFAGEDRDLLFPIGCDPAAKENYLKFYSVSRLRDMAAKVLGTRHGDLWSGLKTVFSKLSVEGCPPLALLALDSFLWDPQATFALNEAELSNVRLLSAVRNLAYITEGSARQKVDYRNIGAEEIGGIYENIISLSPILDIERFAFTLGEGAFSERDETASHYTPTSLVDELLNSALNPALDRVCGGKDPAKAILALKVCDRACGSGHFLVTAAKRMAKRLASIRTDEAEPSPEHIQEALRDVIAHSIYGVDSNPTAVELCKFSLWLESMAHGRPLSFLENRIKCGNSLLGATPATIARGIPDEAFAVLSRDDKAVVSALKKRNKKEREELEQGQQSLFGEVMWIGWVNIREGAEKIIAIDDDEIEHIHKKQAEYERLLVSDSYQNQKLIADAWCAAFMLPRIKGAPAITAATFEEIKNDPGSCPETLRQEIERIATEYELFHWHIEFPEVYSLPKEGEKPENSLSGWNGGFDVNIGNPPWDRVKLQEKEWFAERVPEIAKAPNASKRKQMIEALKQEQPFLFEQFQQALRRADGESHLLRASGLFPLCARGDINLYTVFTEANRVHLGRGGRMGLVIPSGIASDDTTKYFFRDIVEKRSLVSLFSFENEERLFPGTDHRVTFCLLTLASQGEGPEFADFIFYARQTTALKDDWRRFSLNARDFCLLNSNTRTCPIFRTARDAEITKAIYRRVPILVNESSIARNPWGVSFLAMFHMANDSHLFRTQTEIETEGWNLHGNIFRRGSDEYLPLYEAKMLHHYNHRYSDYADRTGHADSVPLPRVPLSRLIDAGSSVIPHYWIRAADVDNKVGRSNKTRWLLGWRDICRNTDQRTVIASLLPRAGVGDKFLLMFTQNSNVACLYAALCSFPLDYVARQKLGGVSLKYFTMRQLPVPHPAVFASQTPWYPPLSLIEWVGRRVLELTFTAWDLEPFARDCGYNGSPFRWNEDRRFLLRCELDAAFFHLYIGTPEDWQKGHETLTSLFPTPRSAVEYMMETFPIVRRQDMKTHDRYRTKETILEIYDAMAHAMKTGEPYQTLLDPPAADSSLTHDPAPPAPAAEERGAPA
jgi:hypothetical protein